MHTTTHAQAEHILHHSNVLTSALCTSITFVAMALIFAVYVIGVGFFVIPVMT